MQPLLDALSSAAPLIAAGLASMAIAFTREHVARLVKPKYLPILLPIAGGVVASVAQLVGFDVGDFNAETANLDAWQTAIAGVMTGGFMVGLHQIPKQLRKPE
jgi:membrane associated rhomboid family serine protease